MNVLPRAKVDMSAINAVAPRGFGSTCFSILLRLRIGSSVIEISR
jgi:hypothetical protein